MSTSLTLLFSSAVFGTGAVVGRALAPSPVAGLEELLELGLVKLVVLGRSGCLPRLAPRIPERPDGDFGVLPRLRGGDKLPAFLEGGFACDERSESPRGRRS